MINVQLPPFIKAAFVANCEVFSATSAQRACAHMMVTQMLRSLYSEQQSVFCWVNNSSGNVGCQRTVNSMQLKLPFSAVQYR